MPIPLLDLKITDPAIRQEIDKALATAVDRTAFVGGPEVSAFESEFAKHVGAGYGVGVANGTDALILALRALGVGPGDEVVTVPFTFIATTEAITAVGAKIRFVDIDPKTYTLDINFLKKAITPQTKAILPVHLFGQPCDMDPILDLAKEKNLKVISDAAQAHGAEYKGKKVGGLGNAACYSFYPTKNLGGFGDGGAVVSNSKELIEKIRQIANHGRAANYRHVLEGVNSRLDGIQAAVLRVLLRSLDSNNEKRRKIALAYNKALAGHSYISAPEIAPTAKHVFHLYCVESSYRDEVMQKLRDNHVGCGIYYPLPLHLQPAYAHLKLGRGSFTISERLSDRIFSVPLFPTMTADQIETVAKILHSFIPQK